MVFILSPEHATHCNHGLRLYVGVRVGAVSCGVLIDGKVRHAGDNVGASHAQELPRIRASYSVVVTTVLFNTWKSALFLRYGTPTADL